MHEREWDHARCHQQQADGNQLWFTHAFDEPADGSALDKRADDSAIRKEESDRTGVLSSLSVEIEVFGYEQAKRCFKAGEAKGREEKNRDQQTYLGDSKRVPPLRETRTSGGPHSGACSRARPRSPATSAAAPHAASHTPGAASHAHSESAALHSAAPAPA